MDAFYYEQKGGLLPILMSSVTVQMYFLLLELKDDKNVSVGKFDVHVSYIADGKVAKF